MAHPLFSDEHEMLRRSIHAFVEKEVAPRVGEWEAAGRIPRELWQRLGELGFLGLEFPTEYGGSGADFLASVVLGEEMARCRSGGVAFSVLVHTDMSSPWLVRFGTDAQKRKYLPGIARGETVCALGITEPGAGSDMAALTTRAERDGDVYRLTGSKIFITNGVYGDLYFVAARTDAGTPDRRHAGISMFLVERGLPGFTVSRKLDKMGMRARGVDGQALRHRGSQPRGVRSGADARRLRLHARVPRGRLLPRRAAVDHRLRNVGSDARDHRQAVAALTGRMKRRSQMTIVRCLLLMFAVVALGVASVGAQDVVKLGQIEAQTGPNAIYGWMSSQGTALAVDEVNKAGGFSVGGKAYKLQ